MTEYASKKPAQKPAQQPNTTPASQPAREISGGIKERISEGLELKTKDDFPVEPIQAEDTSWIATWDGSNRRPDFAIKNKIDRDMISIFQTYNESMQAFSEKHFTLGHTFLQTLIEQINNRKEDLNPDHNLLSSLIRDLITNLESIIQYFEDTYDYTNHLRILEAYLSLVKSRDIKLAKDLETRIAKLTYKIEYNDETIQAARRNPNIYGSVSYLRLIFSDDYVRKDSELATCIAGTDVGYMEYKRGVDPEERNQDRLLIGTNMVSVFDGIGFFKDSGLASQIYADCFARNPKDSSAAFREANEILELAGISGDSVFASARVFQEQSINSDTLQTKVEIQHVGDCRALILSPTQGIKFATIDEGEASEIALQKGLPSVFEDFNTESYKKYEEFVQNYYNKSIVHRHLGKHYNSIKSEIIDVEKGDLVLVFSDGIGDNITNTEILKYAQECDFDFECLIQKLVQITKARMNRDRQVENTEFVTIDPKADNLTIGGYKIK